MELCKIKLILAAIIVNIILSLVVPALINKDEKNKSFINQIRRIFEVNSDVILANSIIIGLTVYLAIEITPYLTDSDPSFGPDDVGYITRIPNIDPRFLTIGSIR